MVSIEAVTFEHHPDGFGIGHSQPRLSVRYGSGPEKDWKQTAVEIEITRDGNTQTVVKQTAESALIPWPFAPLQPRERAHVRVRATGSCSDATEWFSADVEAALLDAGWNAELIAASEKSDPAKEKPPTQFTSTFQLSSPPIKARLYATAYGIYEVTINGQRVGDQYLAPGWTAYNERLRYQTYDVTGLLQLGNNVITAQVGEGWYAGRLGNKGGNRNLWGDRLAFLAQLEVDDKVACKTDQQWEWTYTQTTRGEIYDGEDFDSRLVSSKSHSSPVDVLPFPTASLVSADSPPVRKILEVKAESVITSPSGKTIIDFGQNLVGWLRLNINVPGEGQVTIRHAEVLEHGELGVRPLRDALATDHITLGGPTAGWEPKFTFHGFRYAEVTGVPNLDAETFTAVAISSDMRPTGTFESSHALINRLHKNVVWSTRGNFVSVPTDCPQRDERLGWTGDIQVFAPTANYLYDTSAFLSDWLLDLASEQAKHNGIPPFVIPDVPMRTPHRAFPHSVWADVTALLPRDLYTTFGDGSVLDRQFDSMTDWLDRGVPRQADGLWDPYVPQFADWLDPRAPPEYPAHGSTDTHFVANAYLVHTTQVVAVIAKLLGKKEAYEKYQQEAERLLKLWRAEYLSATGRTVSDSQTALALALHFGLVNEKERGHAAERLNHLVRWWSFKITTGFAGTPILLDTLANTGYLGTAYRMLQEKDLPSWLYPVGMGATTIWERWDSMLPDGTINPGQMTSFNHYALGAVAAFLHGTVGGLSPHTPGWKTALVKPRPGGTITSASTSYSSTLGTYSVSWKIKDGALKVDVQVPPNGSAIVDLPRSNSPVSVGSGAWSWTIDWKNDDSWPPKQLPGPSRVMMPDEYVP